jgi:hypothetical protein
MRMRMKICCTCWGKARQDGGWCVDGLGVGISKRGFAYGLFEDFFHTMMRTENHEEQAQLTAIAIATMRLMNRWID